MAAMCSTIGDGMKVYRGKNGLTQRQLGELLGVKQTDTVQDFTNSGFQKGNNAVTDSAEDLADFAKEPGEEALFFFFLFTTGRGAAGRLILLSTDGTTINRKPLGKNISFLVIGCLNRLLNFPIMGRFG